MSNTTAVVPISSKRLDVAMAVVQVIIISSDQSPESSFAVSLSYLF